MRIPVKTTKVKSGTKKVAKSKFGRAKHPGIEDDEQEVTLPKSSKKTMDNSDMSALITSSDEIRKELQHERDRRAIGQLWRDMFKIDDSETKRVWFRSCEPIGGVYLHRVPNEQGNTDTIPCSMSALGECHMCESGVPKTFYFIYNVVDIDGFYNKKAKKTVKNKPCFYLVSATRKDIFDDQLDGRHKLGSKRIITIKRIGSGANTTHLYRLTKEPIPTAAINADDIGKEAAKKFSAPTLEQQKPIVANYLARARKEEKEYE
jgi:hypothetical protein